MILPNNRVRSLGGALRLLAFWVWLPRRQQNLRTPRDWNPVVLKNHCGRRAVFRNRSSWISAFGVANVSRSAQGPCFTRQDSNTASNRSGLPLLSLNTPAVTRKCNFCTQVCPTGAIQPLDPAVKKKTHMGLAVVNTETCLPFREDGREDCNLCFVECGTGWLSRHRNASHRIAG